jgi:hypothetical protein
MLDVRNIVAWPNAKYEWNYLKKTLGKQEQVFVVA